MTTTGAPRFPGRAEINDLTLNLLHEFMVEATGRPMDVRGSDDKSIAVRVTHVRCETPLEVPWVPWLWSDDGEYTIRFQPLLAAVQAADTHLRECTWTDGDD